MIPTEIYIYFLIFVVVLLVLVGLYAFFYQGLESMTKTIIIWYVIILGVNLMNIISVFKFYEKNKNRKGIKGVTGDPGPRGFKGVNQQCSSCGDAGMTKEIYGSVINDNGEKVLSKNVKEGKCIFPFSHNYKYNYDCIRDSPPPGMTTNDASMFGWCATKIDENYEPSKYAYCNANSSIQEKQQKEADLRQRRKDFIQNNSGILDIDIVAENTTKKAKQRCEEKNGYEFYDKDLNEGTDGKFIHLCIKKGLGSTGVTGIMVQELTGQSPAPTFENLITNDDGTETKEVYRLINKDINKDSGPRNGKYPKLYMYKKIGNRDYIKDINILKESEGTCESIDYTIPPECDEKYCGDLNFGTHRNGSVDRLQLCISRTVTNMLSIDTAFVYKDSHLYILRGSNFYKMKKNPIQGTITSENNYPKNIAEKWGKQKGKSKDFKPCSELTETKCKATPNCNYDDTGSTPRCEEVSNYDAAFTYGYNNKTYFFKGSKVFTYDDKNMKMTENSPENISDVFPGVPNNINAVFTWAKDNKTYFFKGPFYYKYDDKNKKLERGYPKRSNARWKNMPTLIDAIFSLPYSLGEGFGTTSTYVISGDQSWFIDPSNDNLINQKPVDSRFVGLSIIEEEKTGEKDKK